MLFRKLKCQSLFLPQNHKNIWYVKILVYMFSLNVIVLLDVCTFGCTNMFMVCMYICISYHFCVFTVYSSVTFLCPHALIFKELSCHVTVVSYLCPMPMSIFLACIHVFWIWRGRSRYWLKWMKAQGRLSSIYSAWALFFWRIKKNCNHLQISWTQV